MVKYALDAEASAIASAARRAIIDRLAIGPASMSELAVELDVSLPAIDKHLRVLDEAGIVAKAKNGRTTQISLERGSLTELATWAMSTGLMWSNTLDRFAAHLANEPKESC
jgi:DNA-binding transcriptional ArsR family regulator